MTTKDCGTPVSRTSKSKEVTPSLEQVASVSPVCPHGWNEPKLTRMKQERVILLAVLHSKHVEVAKVLTVSFTSPATWVGCRPHSCLFLGTGLESLLWGHSAERRASTTWRVVVFVPVMMHLRGCRRFLQGLVHTVPERPIGTTWSGKALHTQFWPNVLEFS